MSDMSEGARILIERMKTNPEDFEYSGKYHEAIRAARALMRNDPTNIPISRRDAEAILIAAEELWENTLTELVVRSLVEDMYPFISQARQYELETQQKQAHLASQMQANQAMGQYTIGTGGRVVGSGGGGGGGGSGMSGLMNMGMIGQTNDPRGLYGNPSLQQSFSQKSLSDELATWPEDAPAPLTKSAVQQIRDRLFRK